MIDKYNPYLAKSKGDNPYIKKETESLEPVCESVEPVYSGIVSPNITSVGFYDCKTGYFPEEIKVSGTFVTGGFDWLT